MTLQALNLIKPLPVVLVGLQESAHFDRCGCVPPRKVQWRLWIDPHTGF